MKVGKSLKTALAGTIHDWFFDDENGPDRIIQPVIDWLEKEANDDE